MAETETTPLVRVCPACGKRAPGKLTICRCGQDLSGVPLTEPPAPAATPISIEPDSPPQSIVTFLAKMALVLLIVGGTFYWSTRRASPIPATKTAPKAGSAAPASQIATATSPGAAPPAQAATAEGSPAAAPDAPEPTALERVMAAAAKSKRAEEAEAADAAAAPAKAPATLEEVISRAMPALVRVETSTGFGSGFFITPDTILTNVHVVGTNASVTIGRRDGTKTMARVETTAPELDIAIIRISNPDPNQTTLPLGSGTSARAGQEVLAIGTPLGLQNTVTRGIVSAVREVGGLTLVQTDAAINPGNSGGPLLDRSGQVIGITTMGVKAADAQGLSFAVAIEHAKALLAGKRTTDQKGTPLSTLNEAMSGRPAPPVGDTTRERAAKTFDLAIAAEARRADALDERWHGFKRSCYQGRVTGTFDREWFALWDSRAMQGAVSPGCEGTFADIRRVADEIRSAVFAAGEAARRADVYPGTRREALQRNHLNYAGWDR